MYSHFNLFKIYIVGWSMVLCKILKFIKIYRHKFKYVLSYVVKMCCKYGVN